MLPIGWRNRFRRVLTHWKHCAARLLQTQAMLTSDFKEFAKLLNSNQVEYLIVGG